MKTLVIIFVTLVTTTFMACTKQMPPELDGQFRRQSENELRGKSCGKVHLLNDLLNHDNVINLFECAGWVEKFPALFSGIKKVKSDSWNHLFMPFDKFYLSNSIRRRELINSFKKLDADDGLNDLSMISSHLITTFLGNNFFENISEIDFKDALGLITNNSKNPGELRQLLSVLLDGLEDIDFEELKLSYSKTFINEDVKTAQVNFFDLLSTLLKNGTYSKLEHEVIPAMLDARDVFGNSWINSWLNQDSFSDEEFIKILFYPVQEYIEVGRDFRKTYSTALAASKPNFKCQNGGEKSFSFEREINKNIKILANEDRVSFVESLYGMSIKLLLLEATCGRDDDFYQRSKRAFDKTSNFIKSEKMHQLLKMLHQVALSKSKGGEDFKYFLIEYLAGDVFEKFNDFNIELFNNSSKIYTSLFSLLKNVDSSFYSILGSLMGSFYSDDNRPVIQALGKIWSDSNKIDKLNLLKFIDLHFFTEMKKSLEVINFYLEITKDIDLLVDDLSENIGKDRDQTYKSVIEFSEIFKEDEIRRELISFTSKDHLLELVSILGKNSVGAETKPQTKIVNRGARGGIYYSLGRAADKDVLVSDFHSCLYSIMNLEGGARAYYQIISSFPEACMSLHSENYLWQMQFALNQFQQEYVLFYPDIEGALGVLGPEGVLSRQNIDCFLSLILIINDNFSFNGKNGINSFIEYFRKVLIDHKQKDTLDTAISTLNEFNLGLLKVDPQYQDQLVKELGTSTDRDVINSIEDMLIYIDGYYQHKDNINYILREHCLNTFDRFIGFDPCFSKKYLKDHLGNIFSIFNNRFEGSPSLIEEFVDLIHPDQSFRIPSKNYHLTLGEAVYFLYDLSDSKSIDRKRYFKSKKDFDYAEMDLLTQVEVVIREISFKNNFFNSYFINEVSTAEDYKQKVKQLNKQMRIFDKMSLKLTGEERRRIRNTLEVFSSLEMVDNVFTNGDVVHRYGDLVQSLLVLTTKTSHRSVQSFSPFKKDATSVGDLHNSKLITEIVNLSGLRHAAFFLRSRMGLKSINDLIASPGFKRVNGKLISMFSPQELKREIFKLIKSDGKQKSVGLMAIERFIDLWDEISDEDRQRLENVMFNLAVVLTYSDSNLDDLLRCITPMAKIFIAIYDNKELWGENISLSEMIMIVDKNIQFLSDGLLNDVRGYSKLINSFFTKIKDYQVSRGLEQFNVLFKSNPGIWVKSFKNIYLNARPFFKSLSSADIKSMVDNVKRVVYHPAFSLTSVFDWIYKSSSENYRGEKNPFYCENTRLLNYFASSGSAADSNFTLLLDRLFVKDFEGLQMFLNDLANDISL